jgi:eukaryotic-like serine/threonine-protein kinase
VISQEPAARSRVRKGSAITLAVSLGPKPMNAPNLVGMTVADAQSLAQKMGVTLDTSQVAADPNVPRGVIDAQDLTPGTQVERGQTIHATVSMGAGPAAQSVSVPNTVGSQYADAISALQKLGLQPAIRFIVQPDKNGTIIDQDPAADTQASAGSRVTLTLSVNGEVPDTEGETVEAATQTLAQYGYQVGKIQYTTTEGASGNVVRTDPDAGTSLQPGSPVTLIVNGTGQ